MQPKILVCDPIAQEGIEALQPHAEVDIRRGLSPEELQRTIGEYHAVIVRSETRIDARAIEAGYNLQVIARAGVGVDNIDIDTATERGIIVVNAPTGNTISAAEHTIALMLAMARNVSQADASLKAGAWERSRFTGVELMGKTLGIVGLGQVGSEVARRARAMEMRLIAYDPFVPEDRARMLGTEMVTFESLLSESDFITLHTPLTEGTKHLIGEREIRTMKSTTRLINVARGGLIDEEALLNAVEDGRLAGAAVDVFTQEPTTDNVLFKSDKILVTPHLGASTTEAQERVAVDVAVQVIAALKGEPVRYAVNAPLIPPETLSFLAPHMQVATKAALVATQLCEGQIGEIQITYAGDVAAYDTTPLRAAAIRGLMRPISEEMVNMVNADLVAARRGLRISEQRGPSHDLYNDLITVHIKTSAARFTVSGTQAHDGPHIVAIDEFTVDVPPGEGYLLLCDNRDQPGMIGAVGTLVGSFDVNISFMNVGRQERRGHALMVLTLDEALTPEQLDQVRKIPNIYSVKLVRL